MTELNKLLTQHDKGTQNAENIPAKILRGLLLDMAVGPIQMNQLLNSWLDRLNNGKPLDGNDRSNRRGNLIKEISRDRLTWSVFEKAIGLLDFDEWEITFRGKKNGKTYKQTFGYKLRETEQYEQFMHGLREDEYAEKQAHRTGGVLTGWEVKEDYTE